MQTETPEVIESTNPGLPAEEIIQTEAPKKRRGRPPKNPTVEGETPPAAGPTAKPRKTKGGTSAVDIQALGKQLVGIHQLGAMFTGIGELTISPDEGVALASGVIGVCEQYDLEIDGKTGAAIQLLGTMAMIYAPRFMMFRHRIAEEKKRAPVDVQATTVQ